MARSLAPRPGTAAETYVAYGVTQKLFEACSRQADYRIPQVSQKDAQVPKTDAGEDLGVGEGWWYEGVYCLGLQWLLLVPWFLSGFKERKDYLLLPKLT